MFHALEFAEIGAFVELRATVWITDLFVWLLRGAQHHQCKIMNSTNFLQRFWILGF